MTASFPPKAKGFDQTFAFLREGYVFAQNRRRDLGDVFVLRLLLKPMLAIGGPGAAEIFYDQSKMIRHGALPLRIQKTLMGKGGVQMLDGPDHDYRKALFMALVTPESLQRLMAEMQAQWQAAAATWLMRDQVVLMTEAQQVLCRALCAWSGIPVHREDELRGHAHDLFLMVDGFGGIGLRYQRAKFARKRSEKWIMRWLQAVRDGSSGIADESPLAIIARHRDLQGTLLPLRVAAVELLNIIRPAVAISYYIAFATLALHLHPEWRARLRAGSEDDLLHFIHEVRRFYPFAPLLGAKVKAEFSWQGVTFPKDCLVLLDVHGSNHDERLWEQPTQFQPERYRTAPITPFNFIPHGGGEVHHGHRCAGEHLTIQTLQIVVSLLARLRYAVPQQDLSYHLSRMPTFPQSGFVIRDVRV